MLTDAHPRRTGEAAAELSKQFGREVPALTGDVTQRTQIEDAVAKTIARFGRIDVLFNNASINKLEPIWECKDETWDLVSSMWLPRYVLGDAGRATAHDQGGQGRDREHGIDRGLDHGRRRRGALRCGQSRSGGAYARAASAEVADKGIRVKAIAPGVTYNVILERIYPKSMFEGAKKAQPNGSAGRAGRSSQSGHVPR